MRSLTAFLLLIVAAVGTEAQTPLRPDAFPPVAEKPIKGIVMAESVEEMLTWDRYPTYETYTDMMQRFATQHSAICRLDTIGYSYGGRLLLSLVIEGNEPRREMLYSGTIHGNEPLGSVLLLHLADTLLASYGSNPQITNLLDTVAVAIIPISNPDGLYHDGNHTIEGGTRYNANGADLNRNFPDPFGATPIDTLQRENQTLIDYISRHRFTHAASLHSGGEVLNYPWDSFTASQRRHPQWQWWEETCRRFVAIVRQHDSQRLRTVRDCGYITGGDWYVISNGRQDYLNYYHAIYDLTIELSQTKQIASDQLPHYWHAYAEALIDYIGIVPPAAVPSAIHAVSQQKATLTAYPNPTTGEITVRLGDRQSHYDLRQHPSGLIILNAFGHTLKVIKR